jgi:hypothetical protein
MSTEFVQQAVRQSNRRILTFSLLGILILAGVAALSYRYLVSFATGPVEVSQQTLLALKDANELPVYYVTVKGEETLDTGFQTVSRSRRSGTETVSSSYAALIVDRRALLVKLPGVRNTRVTQFSGALVGIPSDVRTRVVGEVEDEVGEKGLFLPFMLDASDFRTNGYIGLAVGAVILLLCLFGLVRAISRSANPAAHPIMRALSRFGEPEAVAERINQEMAGPHETVGSVHLTPHWLVISSGGTFNVTRFEDVAWAYLKVTQHRTNGIPTGKTYSALIWDRHGTNLIANGKENTTEDVLKAIYRHAPWAIVGFNGDIEKAWKSNRQAVLAAVAQRRQEILSGQGQPA